MGPRTSALTRELERWGKRPMTEGRAIADQRKAIIEGLRESVGELQRANTILIRRSPGNLSTRSPPQT